MNANIHTLILVCKLVYVTKGIPGYEIWYCVKMGVFVIRFEELNMNVVVAHYDRFLAARYLFSMVSNIYLQVLLVYTISCFKLSSCKGSRLFIVYSTILSTTKAVCFIKSDRFTLPYRYCFICCPYYPAFIQLSGHWRHRPCPWRKFAGLWRKFNVIGYVSSVTAELERFKLPYVEFGSKALSIGYTDNSYACLCIYIYMYIYLYINVYVKRCALYVS